jgi:hypothetical protein
MDPGSPNPSNELGSEFWKDLPDDVLEDIFNKFEYVLAFSSTFPFIHSCSQITPSAPEGGGLGEGELLLDDLGNSGAWRTKSQTPSLQSEPIFNLKQEGSLSLSQSGSAFLSSSQQPQQTALALPTFNQIPATAQQVRARGVIEQAWKVLATHDQIITQLKQAFPQLGTPPAPDRVKEIQEQQQKLTPQIDTSLKELKQLNKMQVLEADDLHDSKVCIQRFTIQQIENDLMKQELLQLLNPQPNQPV